MAKKQSGSSKSLQRPPAQPPAPPPTSALVTPISSSSSPADHEPQRSAATSSQLAESAARHPESQRQSDPDRAVAIAPAAPARLPCPIIGIGASADGIEALTGFLTALGRIEQSAIVVVLQGGKVEHHETLIEAVRRAASIPVTEAVDGIRLEPGRLYLTLDDSGPTVIGDRLCFSEAPADGAGPIDRLFESLALERAERATAIVLAGSGDDGAIGVRAIKDLGGVTMALRPDHADPREMPANAIASGLVDAALALDGLAARVTVADQRGALAPGAPPVGAIAGGGAGTGRSAAHDTAQLPALTLTNRPGRLLFRDPEVWASLRQRALEPMLRSRSGSVPLRVWVPQCGSGEDAYSIAILIEETIRALDVHPEVRIFATDADPELLTKARAGHFDADTISALSPARRQYFVSSGERTRVLGWVRDLVVFARHELDRHPPFAQLDLIICRDLVRRLAPSLQAQALQIFRTALTWNGILVLDAADTIATQRPERWFEVVDRRRRIFRAAGPDFKWRPELAARARDAARARGTASIDFGANRSDTARILHDALVGRYAPPSVLVDQRFNVLELHGDTKSFLSPPDGEPTTDLLAMLDDDARWAVRSAVRRALEERAPVSVGVPPRADGPDGRVVVTVTPVDPSRGTAVVVSFERIASIASDSASLGGQAPRATVGVPGAAASPQEPRSGHVTGRERPARDAGDQAVELNRQLQDAVADLRCANEELESSRGQLQSMNEELQEVNERLTGANVELETKAGELVSVADDLANLLDGTDVATVFLDREQRVRRYTPAVRGLIPLRPADLGRPLAHFALEFEDSSLFADIERVLETSAPAEAVASVPGDRWLLRRIVPYRTREGTVDGVVITFTDITWRQRAQEALRRSNEELEDHVKRRTAVIRLLQDAAVIANSAGPMEEAFAATLRRICQDEHWVAGHVYVVRGDQTEDTEVWHVASRALDGKLQSLLADGGFAPSDSLVGRVIETGEARWSSDVAPDERLGTAATAALGVRSALAFPILVGERVVGAFEFFSTEVNEPTPALLEVMRNVGTQVGRVIEREEARERLLDLAVEEQRSLGEELHDTLSQQIHGLSMLAQSVVQTQSSAGIDDGRVRALVDGLLDTHRQIRMLSSGLVPVRVEAGGLEGALDEMARGWEQMHGTACVFEREGEGDPDDERVATALYRIAREAARNAGLHGAAERIVIRLRGTENAIELEVRDDGQGMDPVPVEGPGMGLQIMRHRAELVGGVLDIDSMPGRGTVVRCRISTAARRGAGDKP